MTKARWLLLAGLVVLRPATASAQEGWIDWIERMSGPGSFLGYNQGFPICTVKGDGPCWTNVGVKQDLDLRVGFYTSFPTRRFSNDPTNDTRAVYIVRFNPQYRFHFEKGGRRFTYGLGAGLLRFLGADTPSKTYVEVTPWSLWASPWKSYPWVKVGYSGIVRLENL